MSRHHPWFCASRAFLTITIKLKTEVGVEGVLAATPFKLPYPDPTENVSMKMEGVQDGASSKPTHVVLKNEEGSGPSRLVP